MDGGGLNLVLMNPKFWGSKFYSNFGCHQVFVYHKHKINFWIAPLRPNLTALFFCFLFGSLIPRMYTLYQPAIFWIFAISFHEWKKYSEKCLAPSEHFWMTKMFKHQEGKKIKSCLCVCVCVCVCLCKWNSYVAYLLYIRCVSTYIRFLIGRHKWMVALMDGINVWH